MPNHHDREIMAIVKLMIAQGWRVESTNHPSHFIAYSPDGERLFTFSHTGDRRGVKNVIALCRRNGIKIDRKQGR